MLVKRLTKRAVMFGGAVAASAVMASSAMAEVTIRIASDTSGLPHPAAIAMEKLKEGVEAKIPGSDVRIFVAASLYKIAESVEAMTEGNLEMAWGQFGKTAQIEPFANVVLGPMLLTTPGAIDSLDSFETYKMFVKRMNDIHDVKIFGSSHLSFYMGAGAKFRLLGPDTFADKKIRSMGPAENAMLKAWGANPTTMAFGDVPPALETGVIDGLLTSLGGFNRVKEQAPFFSVAGINGIVGDYYWIAAANKWWNGLKPEHQKIIEDVVMNDVIPVSKQANYCNDKLLIDKYGTEDPTKPGIYIMSDDEAKALAVKLGSATSDWIKANTPASAHEWVDKFAEEAKAAVAKWPKGSSELEKTDCKAMAELIASYQKK